MPKKNATVKITNPAASRLPRQVGEFSTSVAKPDPVTPVPRRRVGELIRSSKSVLVTNKEAQR
jgi:hypothetical protein